jgi:zinc protease
MKVEALEATLSNGLKVRLFPNRGIPVASLHLFYRVGSRNERPGITGISHLFEHMMFNGSKNYGPKEFDRVLESHGGSSNAYTTNDFTSYQDVFAAESLEKVLELEADRMRSLQINDRMLSSEREVVKEERRATVDNDFFGLMHEELEALVYKAHPYRWPIIGWMGDLDLIDRKACETYFRTYYAPNNATLFLAGDFNPKAALTLVRKHFGQIPRGPAIPDVAEYEPEPLGERRAVVRRPAQAPSLVVGYQAPRAQDPDTLVLDVIQYALGVGNGSRLNRELVFGQELAVGMQVDWSWRFGPGIFTFFLELKPDTVTVEVEQALYRELDKLGQEGLTERELERAKNNLHAHTLRALTTNERRADTLGNYEMLLGSWQSGLALEERYRKISNQDIQRVARQYFSPRRRSVVTLVPESSSP